MLNVMTDENGFVDGNVEFESIPVYVEQCSLNSCELSDVDRCGKFTLRRGGPRRYQAMVFAGQGFVTVDITSEQRICARVAANALRKVFGFGTLYHLGTDGLETLWMWRPR